MNTIWCCWRMMVQILTQEDQIWKHLNRPQSFFKKISQPSRIIWKHPGVKQIECEQIVLFGWRMMFPKGHTGCDSHPSNQSSTKKLIRGSDSLVGKFPASFKSFDSVNPLQLEVLSEVGHRSFSLSLAFDQLEGPPGATRIPRCSWLMWKGWWLI